MDLLQQSAQAWKEITEYRYLFTYGYKNQLYPINLTFSLEDYPHLAGFQTNKAEGQSYCCLLYTSDAADE